MKIAVQVNGKVRASVEVASDADQETIVQAALADEKVRQYVAGEPKKTIYVPKKLVSFVV
jgi:leucyl-tRNA synthetase